MKRAFILSVVDQAILSALSLLLGLVLIRFATPEALGHYTLAMAVFFMFFSIQFSLVALPISTRIYGLGADAQRQVLETICTVDLIIIAAGMLVMLGVLMFFAYPVETIAAATLMVVGGLWRELSRSVFLARGDMRQLVRMDIAATGITTLLVAGFWQILPPEVACLAGMGIGTGFAATALGPRLPLAPVRLPQILADYREHYFGLTRWSLTGGVAWELQNRAYVFIVQLFRGVAANGILQASRLIVSPIDLVAMAWGRVAVPRMAAQFRLGDSAAAYRMTWINLVLMTGFALAWCLALYLLWFLIEPLVFAGKYPGIVELVIAWGVFMTISAPLRCLEWIFQAQERFRELALMGVANAVISLGLLMLLALPVPLYTALIILTFGIVCVIAGLVWQLLRTPPPMEAVT